ncbi:MAG: hypothetical protein JJ975_06690 [Bacteroidia bacterium]|nr:hypothetical protein [Bacteroidia bacterium]
MARKEDKVSFESGETIEPYGLFIGLTTMPMNKDLYEEHIGAINRFFKNYKKNVAANNEHLGIADDDVDKKTFDQALYRPLSYILWGSYDLVTLNLIDDTGIGTRSFHPYSSLFKDIDKNNHYSKSFDYQVHTAFSTKLYHPDNSTPERPLASLVEDISKEKQLIKKGKSWNNGLEGYPFISVSTLKINSSILIGSGVVTVDLIKSFVNTKIAKYANKFRTGEEGEETGERGQTHVDPNLEYRALVLESQSWHELVLVIFSTNVQFNSEVLLVCREYSFYDLEVAYAKCNIFKDHVEQIKKLSLARYLYDDLEEFNIQKEPLTPHLFTDCYTHFGYDFDAILEFDNLDQKSKVSIKSTIFGKPGHLRQMVGFVLGQDGSQGSSGGSKYDDPKRVNGSLVIGDGDFSVNYHARELQKNAKDAKSWSEDRWLPRHFRQIKGNPVIEGCDFDQIDRILGDVENFNVEAHPYVSELLYAKSVSADTIEKSINEPLDRLHLSKILRERILNVFVNFNDGMQDHVLYSYFIEIRGFVLNLANELRKDVLALETKETDIDQLHKKYDKLCTYFETAHKNRIFQSNKLGHEVTDFNSEFNGGIHQALSGIDVAYKVAKSIVHAGSQNHIFASVSSLPGIMANSNRLRINYFHIFHPIIFLATLFKEASNSISGRSDSYSVEFKQLHKRLKEALSKIRIPESIKSRYDFIVTDEEFTNYIIADYFMFKLGYLENKSLFDFWFWHVPLQDPTIYDNDQEVDDTVFLKLLTRRLMLANLGSDMKIYEGDIPNPKYNKVWNSYFTQTNSVVEKLLNHRIDVGEQEQTILRSIDEMVKGHFSHALLLLAKKSGSHRLAVEDLQGLTDQNGTVSGRDEIYANLLWKKFKNELLEGIEDHESPHLNMSLLKPGIYEGSEFKRHLLRMTSKYLDLVSKQFELANPQDETNVLCRIGCRPVTSRKANVKLDQDEKALLRKLNENHSIKFDPLGGFFSYGYSTRKLILRNKLVIMRSLWDMSLHFKRTQLTQKGEDQSKDLSNMMIKKPIAAKSKATLSSTPQEDSERLMGAFGTEFVTRSEKPIVESENGLQVMTYLGYDKKVVYLNKDIQPQTLKDLGVLDKNQKMHYYFLLDGQMVESDVQAVKQQIRDLFTKELGVHNLVLNNLTYSTYRYNEYSSALYNKRSTQ